MNMAETEDVAWKVRAFIYDFIVTHERPPMVAETAAAMSLSRDETHRIYTLLDERHAIFLEPGTHTIRMAHPFSGVPTPFHVHVAGRDYWANCAWDALGIPAALQADATINATRSDTQESVVLKIEGDHVVGRGERVHFARPFRQWYDDLVFTWANILLFRSEEGIDRWCAERGMPRGQSLSLDQVWELSKAWYHNRLDPDFRGRSANEAQGIFRRLGLLDPFWYLDDSG
jgi:hypothetical protein